MERAGNNPIRSDGPPGENNQGRANFLVSPPALSLPKGGGAIRGIGEKFAANPVTGTGSMTFPIITTSGRSGFGPQLSLSYNSGTGNGPFGFGWSLSLPQITRKTDKGLPQYLDATESDVFILSGSEDLVPWFAPDDTRFEDSDSVPDITIHRYRPRIEGLFARIERWTRRSDGDVHWRSISKDNILTCYGKDSLSRIADPEDPRRIFAWLICETRDDKGNAIVYNYKPEDGAGVDLTRSHERNRGTVDDLRRTANRYLKGIRYGNRTPLLDDAARRPSQLTVAQIENADWMFEVVFDYDEHDADVPRPGDAGEWTYRDDPFSSYRAGFELRTTRLCQRILMFHHFTGEQGVGNDCLVRSTDFTYSSKQETENARNPVYTFLRAATQTGYQREGNEYRRRSLPPVEFEYTLPVVQDAVEEVGGESLANLPSGVDGLDYLWTDLHGEGIPGILAERANAWFYKRNLSPIGRTPVEFAPLECVAAKPNLSLASGARFMDLAGDGQPDLVAFEGATPGFYEHDREEGWQPFRPFSSRLNRDTRDPNLRFVDLDGDGHADVLITEDTFFTWYPSLAEAGFGPERRVHQAFDDERGPHLVFEDGTQSIYLADLSGDGLPDLVRIRESEVCYWPNLGHGCFGEKITMDHAPHFDHADQFDQRRLRLTDIDGTGTTDIIYLHRDGVRLYFNQTGNSWSEALVLDVVPRMDDLASIEPIDLLGNGTACLVWSSPLAGDASRPMRFVNLMGGQKPHLLVRTVNNLGAETRVEYAPSTRFYLQDRRDGRPWITKLPFPVHVVERVETFDHIGRNRFVSRYAYHHGYFDGNEREFRGFGMVERIDTEEFATLAADDALPEAANISKTSHVPQVMTRSWFHTGIYLGRTQVSNFYAGLLDETDAGEYYREPDLSDDEAARLLLPDTVLPQGLTLDEEREAVRSLKGLMLRQEVFAIDRTEKELHPYTVTEQNYSIRRLQPCVANRHGVFFTHAREAIVYQYERNPTDPRVTHSCVLATDDFGNVLQTIAVGYGRRQADDTLSPDDRNAQAQQLITYSDNEFTNAIDEAGAFRTPLPSGVSTYEVAGLELATDQIRFSFPELREAVGSATEIPYHATPSPGTLQKRLLERARSLYRRDDLSGSLALGELQSLALPFESYQLAFVPEHLGLVFGDRVTENMLADDGRYVHFQADDNWWIPSGQVFFSPSEGDTTVQELAFARQHFFIPRRFRDPFEKTNSVDYDAYDLLPLEIRDPLGNRVTAGERNGDGSVSPRIDYRVLQPELTTDPNGNRSAVAFDVLGMVAGNSVMGKATESLGDSLEAFQAQLTQAQVDAFFADPRGIVAADLLGNATSRTIYDESRFQRLERPVYAAAIVRETHVGDLGEGDQTIVQVSLSYSDGFGREIQQKAQAEPGPVPRRDASGAIILETNGQPEITADDVSPRWVGSGWTVFNNKGQPVRQYEPFFTDTHEFEFDQRIGVSPTLFYDPIGRVVATLQPNHSWEKVVFDPWRQVSYDVNDTVLMDAAADPDAGDYFRRMPEAEYLPTWHGLRSDPDHAAEAAARWPDAQRLQDEASAATKAAAHADTPGIVHFDALGRPFLSIADNGAGGLVETRTERDLEGNPLRVIDDRGNIVMAYQVVTNGNPLVLGYDAAGRQLYENSMDAGERRLLADIGGQPIRSWDSRGHVFRTEYDELRRPVRAFVAGADADDPEREILFQRTVYGEDQGDALNHRGRVFQLFDGAGVVTSDAYDFKGNLRRSSRQLAANYRDAVDWSLNPVLETEVFRSEATYDALNRPTSITTPDNSVTLPTYNEANLLEQLAVRLRGADRATPFVASIDYNARGERERIVYTTSDGTNFTTTYDYEPDTFRLSRLHTRRQRDNRNLQDLNYSYDPVGNITSIRDRAQQNVFFANAEVEPHCDYSYDALYRLIRAEGREHAIQNNLQRDATDFDPLIGIAFPSSPEALQRYVETYDYDGVGNILRMAHRGGAIQRWARRYRYADDNNRLLATSLPGDDTGEFSAPYTYDAHGNMTTMPHLPLMQWDFKDQLQATNRQVIDEGTPETTYYIYDGAGQRVRKVTERQAAAGQSPSRRDERLYLGGVEIYREYNGDGNTLTLERESLHVMDDTRRIVLVETRTEGNDGSPVQLIRYQLENHLGSVMLEVDDQANVISYEEYHPYGTSAYRAGRSVAEVSLKRYRNIGKEKDEETALYYHGARYYACWLGRWVTPDPAAILDGVNRYRSSRSNPIQFIDVTGLQAVASPQQAAGFVRLFQDVITTQQIAQEAQAMDEYYHEQEVEFAIQLVRENPKKRFLKRLLEKKDWTFQDQIRIREAYNDSRPVKRNPNQLEIGRDGVGTQENLWKQQTRRRVNEGVSNMRTPAGTFTYWISTLHTDDLDRQLAASGTGAAASGVAAAGAAPFIARAQMNAVVNQPAQTETVSLNLTRVSARERVAEVRAVEQGHRAGTGKNRNVSLVDVSTLGRRRSAKAASKVGPDSSGFLETAPEYLIVRTGHAESLTANSAAAQLVSLSLSGYRGPVKVTLISDFNFCRHCSSLPGQLEVFGKKLNLNLEVRSMQLGPSPLEKKRGGQ